MVVGTNIQVHRQGHSYRIPSSRTPARRYKGPSIQLSFDIDIAFSFCRLIVSLLSRYPRCASRPLYSLQHLHLRALLSRCSDLKPEVHRLGHAVRPLSPALNPTNNLAALDRACYAECLAMETTTTASFCSRTLFTVECWTHFADCSSRCRMWSELLNTEDVQATHDYLDCPNP